MQAPFDWKPITAFSRSQGAAGSRKNDNGIHSICGNLAGSLILLAVLTTVIRADEMPPLAGLLQLSGQILLFVAIVTGIGLYAFSAN